MADSGGEMKVLEDGEAFWRDLRDQRLPFFSGSEPLWRFSVNPTAAMEELGNQALIGWGGAQRWSRQDDSLSVMAERAAGPEGRLACSVTVTAAGKSCIRCRRRCELSSSA